MRDHPRSPAPRPSATAALVLLATIAVGAVATLANPALARAPRASWRDGAWAATYQRQLDAASPLRASAQAVWNALDLAVFRQAPEGVVLGHDGWLFSSEEYAVGGDAEAHRRAFVARMAEVDARIAAAGAELIVALVPAKAVALAAGQPPVPATARDRYDATLADLAALGVRAVDLRPALAALGPAAWLRTDTHWTPAGADAAAAAVAASVAAVAPDLVGAVPFAREPLPTVTLQGDLARLLALGPLEAWLGPAPDRLEPVAVTSLAPPATDLFAAVDLPVAVVGTSYAADPRWNLADRLRAALGSRVLDAAESGAGGLRPMLDYLDGVAWTSTPPRVVVWEMPVRYLTRAPDVAATR